MEKTGKNALAWNLFGDSFSSLSRVIQDWDPSLDSVLHANEYGLMRHGGREEGDSRVLVSMVRLDRVVLGCYKYNTGTHLSSLVLRTSSNSPSRSRINFNVYPTCLVGYSPRAREGSFSMWLINHQRIICDSVWWAAYMRLPPSWHVIRAALSIINMMSSGSYDRGELSLYSTLHGRETARDVILRYRGRGGPTVAGVLVLVVHEKLLDTFISMVLRSFQPCFPTTRSNQRRVWKNNLAGWASTIPQDRAMIGGWSRRLVLTVTGMWQRYMFDICFARFHFIGYTDGTRLLQLYNYSLSPHVYAPVYTKVSY